MTSVFVQPFKTGPCCYSRGRRTIYLSIIEVVPSEAGIEDGVLYRVRYASGSAIARPLVRRADVYRLIREISAKHPRAVSYL